MSRKALGVQTRSHENNVLPYIYQDTVYVTIALHVLSYASELKVTKHFLQDSRG